MKSAIGLLLQRGNSFTETQTNMVTKPMENSGNPWKAWGIHTFFFRKPSRNPIGICTFFRESRKPFLETHWNSADSLKNRHFFCGNHKELREPKNFSEDLGNPEDPYIVLGPHGNSAENPGNPYSLSENRESTVNPKNLNIFQDLIFWESLRPIHF